MKISKLFTRRPDQDDSRCTGKMIRWGILSTGSIAGSFSEGFEHISNGTLQAVASRSKNKAEKFAKRFGIPTAYGSYEELAADQDVDVIYVATPHPFHYENTMMCLEAGKAVLCEKPFAMNAIQAETMISRAREKNCFLMEAMWTRFNPVVVKLREALTNKTVGDIRLLDANFCFGAGFDPSSRLYAPELGGGALLDVGIYVLAFSSMIFDASPVDINGMAHLGKTGVDEVGIYSLRYKNGQMARLSAAIGLHGDRTATLYGTDGHITVHEPFWNPPGMTIYRKGKPEKEINIPVVGKGYQYEAKAVSDYLLAGLKEAPTMPLTETLALAEQMDTLRAKWGLKYPCEDRAN